MNAGRNFLDACEAIVDRAEVGLFATLGQKELKNAARTFAKAVWKQRARSHEAKGDAEAQYEQALASAPPLSGASTKAAAGERLFCCPSAPT